MSLADRPVLAGCVAGSCATAALLLVGMVSTELRWAPLLAVPLAAAFGLAVHKACVDRLRTIDEIRRRDEWHAELKRQLAAKLGNDPTPERAREAVRDEGLLTAVFRRNPERLRLTDSAGRPDVVFSGWCIGEWHSLLSIRCGNRSYAVGQVYVTVGGNVVLLSKETIERNDRVTVDEICQVCSEPKPLNAFDEIGPTVFRSMSDEMDRRIGGRGFHPETLMSAWRKACANFPPLAGKDVVEVD